MQPHGINSAIATAISERATFVNVMAVSPSMHRRFPAGHAFRCSNKNAIRRFQLCFETTALRIDQPRERLMMAAAASAPVPLTPLFAAGSDILEPLNASMPPRARVSADPRPPPCRRQSLAASPSDVSGPIHAPRHHRRIKREQQSTQALSVRLRPVRLHKRFS
jgi:hypothetical protein